MGGFQLGRMTVFFVTLTVLSGCANRGSPVDVVPVGRAFAPTIWESLEVLPSAAAVQREFIPLGLLTTEATPGYFDEVTSIRLRRAAARLGANAVVLEELRVVPAAEDEAPRIERVRAGWQGVATAVRIVDGRWGDRYWQYATAPGPLAAGEPPEEEPETPAAPAGWQRVTSWSGAGVQETDGFMVDADEWRLVWEASAEGDGVLEILVYSLPDRELAARIDQAGMTTGSYLGLAGRGEYYLQINGEGSSWTVAVDAWAQP